MTAPGSFRTVPVVALAGTYGGSWATHDESDPNYNPYVALAGIFKDDPFIDDIDAYVEAERRRQRAEATRLADLEDATAAAAGKEGYDMTMANNSRDVHVAELDGAQHDTPDQQDTAVKQNKYMAFAGMLEHSPFADEVDV